jgi:hypothetical protein
MNMIDVVAEIDIAAAPADVAGVMFDAQREPEWIRAVKGVELVDPALVAGARVRRTGTFAGREFSWVTTVEAVHFPHVLALRLSEGPFTGTVRYDIQRAGAGSRVRIRNAGEAAGLAFPAAMITGPMKAALDGDLQRLKVIVEKSG